MTDIHRFISLTEAAQMLGIYPHRIKQLLRDHLLFVVFDEDGRRLIPACTLVEGVEGWEPLFNLPGTLTLLADAGFSAEETARWMYEVNDELGQCPLEAIVQGRHHHVNRIAGTLAF